MIDCVAEKHMGNDVCARIGQWRNGDLYRFIYHQRNKKHNQNTDVAEAGGCAIDTESLVSMNFWCYPQEFMDVLKKEFPVF